MDPSTATTLGTPVLERLLDYGALGILVAVLAAMLWLERRRADRLESELRAMVKEQTPIMAGQIKQGDRIEGALKGIGESLQTVREAFATLRSEYHRGGGQQ